MTHGTSKRDTEFDVILFGATGFTGALVAEYLVKKRPDVRWALAGRSREKLERVRADLGAIDASARELPIVVGDSLDAGSVEAMVRKTRVVCTTVGPYALYGAPLVAACAEQGVHYCDLTGETLFIRDMIDAHHERAVATGARVVNCCGFDSIPSDLGVLMLHDHLSRSGKRLATAHYRLQIAKGGVSGGTAASLLGMLDLVKDPAVRRKLADPYLLDPAGSPGGGDRDDSKVPERDPDTGRWTGPFLMAPINTRIVRRSNALLGYPYGHDFRYDEATETGTGALGLAKAAGLTAVLGGVIAAGALPGGRALLARALPKPGEGPSRKQRDNGCFRIEIRGEDSAGGQIVGKVCGTSDPGYGETAKMIAEAALCLANDDLRTPGGLLTPASAMGMPLVERLRTAGMTFSVE